MIFVDMDGVVAIYTPSDYEGDPMPFLEPGAHYFATRPADNRAVLLADELSRHTKVCMLSTISSEAVDDPSLAAEHKADKRAWLQKVFAECGSPAPQSAFAVAGKLPKPAVASFLLHRPLLPHDVLVDDFNANLEQWRECGGTAVKYINENNSAASWDGPVILPQDDPISVAEGLLRFEENALKEFRRRCYEEKLALETRKGGELL